MASEQDLQKGTVCFVRGDDMPNFPGREWCESVMPVYLLPRTQDVSSSLIRKIYHSGDEIDHRAAFAPTDYSGKPILS